MTERQVKKQGREAEEYISTYLRSLGREYLVFDNVLLKTNSKGGTTQIDHIVVSPYGIFVIETKSHKGKIFGNIESKNWVQTLITRKGVQKYKFYNPVLQNAGHIRALSKLLGMDYRYFSGIVVFSNPNTDITNVYCGNVCSPYTLATFILYNRKPILSAYQLGYIIQKIQENNIQSTYRDKKHIQYVKNIRKGDKY